MKLTELIICTAIFVLSCSLFLSSLISVRRLAQNTGFVIRKNAGLIAEDFLLREELQDIKVPYWKTLKSEKEKIFERIKLYGDEREAEIKKIEIIYDPDHNCEGVSVLWTLDGKDYITREFIKQRIIDEE